MTAYGTHQLKQADGKPKRESCMNYIAVAMRYLLVFATNRYFSFVFDSCFYNIVEYKSHGNFEHDCKIFDDLRDNEEYSE